MCPVGVTSRYLHSWNAGVHLSVRWATLSDAPWFTKLRGNADGRNAPAGDLVEYPLPAIGSSLAGVAAIYHLEETVTPADLLG